MRNKAGLISNVLKWVSFPSKSNATTKEWAAFVAVAIIAAFLWSTVISTIKEGVAT